MRPVPTPADGSKASFDLIEAAMRPDLPEFAAVVSLRGEHDISTAGTLRRRLRSISGNVLIDLGACEFLDSSVISVFIARSRELEEDGYYLELLVPRENVVVSRTLAAIDLASLIVVHDEPPRSKDPQMG